jgi:hypothetical protein
MVVEEVGGEGGWKRDGQEKGQEREGLRWRGGCTRQRLPECTGPAVHHSSRGINAWQEMVCEVTQLHVRSCSCKGCFWFQPRRAVTARSTAAASVCGCKEGGGRGFAC